MPARKSDSGDAGVFHLKVVTCFPGGRYLETKSIRLNSRALAYEQCDVIQDALDEDCDPARTYVFDAEGIAIRAGRAATYRSNHFFAPKPRRV